MSSKNIAKYKPRSIRRYRGFLGQGPGMTRYARVIESRVSTSSFLFGMCNKRRVFSRSSAAEGSTEVFGTLLRGLCMSFAPRNIQITGHRVSSIPLMAAIRTPARSGAHLDSDRECVTRSG